MNRYRSRVLLALLAAILVFGTWAAPAHATWIVEDGYGEGNIDGSVTVAGGHQLGQSFTSLGGSIFSLGFYVSGYNITGGGDLRVELYEHTGTFGASGLPSGAPIAISSVHTIDESTYLYEGLLDFAFFDTPRLTPGANYVAVLIFGSDPANSIHVGVDTSTPTHPGNVSFHDGVSWSPMADKDAAFSVNSIADTPVLRFYRASTGTHMYTTDPAEAMRLSRLLADTYQYEGVAYFVNPLNAANSRELHRFFNMRQGTHLYTADPAEVVRIKTELSATYKHDGIAMYVSDSSGLAVHRFYSPARGVHFYSTDPAEVASVRQNLGRTWQYEGIAYYVGQ